VIRVGRDRAAAQCPAALVSPNAPGRRDTAPLRFAAPPYPFTIPPYDPYLYYLSKDF